jgi:heptose I phosphotransferase
MTPSNNKINTEVNQGLYLNKAYESLLSENGLTSFDSFLSITPQKIVKRVRESRYTAKVKLTGGGREATAYLKISSYSWLKNLFNTIRKFTRQRDSLTHEYINLVRLRDVGVPSITPIAAGTRVRGLKCKSFLLTDDLGNTQKLEDYVPEEFDKPFSIEQAGRKRVLVDALARLTRQMHEGGVNHRDYYLCHIHILPDAQQWPELYVIDLNRADRRKRVGERWKVKDLAALNYSSPADIFSRTDRLRFLRTYLGVSKVGSSHRKFTRKILKKTRIIARHALRSKAKDSRFMTAAQGKNNRVGCAGEDIT